MQSASRRPDHGVSVAPLNTTVLPVTSAAATGPPASAKREIERRDHHPHAVRPHHAAVARDHAVERIVRQRVLEAVVRFEVVGVVVEEVDGLLRFAERLHAVLADFQRQRGGDVVDALPRIRSPTLRSSARAFGDAACARQAGHAACAAAHRGVDVARVGERELADAPGRCRSGCCVRRTTSRPARPRRR